MSGIDLFDIVIAAAIGVAVWRVSVWAIRLLATPPPQVDPDDTVSVVQSYRCTVCGAEVIMTVQNVNEATPPRHCREDMVAVWSPDSDQR